ncbi:DUF7287 family protein [Salinigranum sp. GCM10025319]|uniref:DUF7287 family protein n=1 Tax=Salinigranum sp. GCM10025319 TaxID=3252687 RepID=UPI0036068A55
MRARRPGVTGDGNGRSSRERGQTTIDFAVGTTLFLLTIAFVFAFVPVMFQPFSTTQSDPLVADRVANRLATDVLGDPAEPYVLDETCTEVFFDGGDPSSYGCHYAYTDASDHPHLAMGVEADANVNVTLVGPTGTVHSVGIPPEDARDVITAQRRVLYEGKSHELYVRVW